MVHQEIPTAEAMALLDVRDPSVISRWVRDGKLTPSRRVGTAMLFWRSDVETLAATIADDLRGRLARLENAS